MSVQNLTPIQKLALAQDEWVAYTVHAITQNYINCRNEEKAQAYISMTEILVRGKLKPVFIIDFDMALYLATNRADRSLEFKAYHRSNNKEQWALWNENNKTPVQKLVTEPLVNGERVRGAALKDKKRARLLESKQRKAI